MPLISTVVSEAQHRAWQRRSWLLLSELLNLGVERELPVLEWSVTEHALVGTCEQPEPARRVVFEAWADALQSAVRTEVPSGGMVRLTAFTENYQGRGVNVAVVANVDEGTP